jgi:hypothetical protein
LDSSAGQFGTILHGRYLASAITSHGSEFIVRILAEHASQLGLQSAFGAQPHDAANGMARAWTSWRVVADHWDIVTTGTNRGAGLTPWIIQRPADYAFVNGRVGRAASSMPDRQFWRAASAALIAKGRSGWRSRLRHVETRDGVDRSECLATEWLEADLFAVQAACDALDHAPLPDRRCIKASASREPPGPLARVFVEELDRIAAHQDSEVAFGFSQHAVWIYQLEILACL